MLYQKVKGTQDFTELDARKLRYLEKTVTDIIKNYGYSEIITPIFENTDVFVRGVGDESDIVSKEMYTFLDKGDRSITLRPEGTAAVVRSFLENKLYVNNPLTKLYYFGPMFRYERPQAGRFRQFYQFGIEAFGDSSPLLDADVIMSAYQIFKGLGIRDVKLKINSIGDFESRKRYAQTLETYFSNQIEGFCDDCQRRLTKNPLRILDCKADKDNPILKNAPKIGSCLTTEAKTYFQAVLRVLDAFGIAFEVDESLVRGLDYYTDTVFEYVLGGGSELKGLAICGGGKYSDLIKSFGGPDIPGIGYAFGVERLISILESQNLIPEFKTNADLVIIGLDEESKIDSLKLAASLRGQGYYAELDYQNLSMKPQFRLADNKKAAFIVIIGADERQNNRLTIKNTITKTQETINKNEIFNYLKENIYENS